MHTLLHSKDESCCTIISSLCCSSVVVNMNKEVMDMIGTLCIVAFITISTLFDNVRINVK